MRPIQSLKPFLLSVIIELQTLILVIVQISVYFKCKLCCVNDFTLTSLYTQCQYNFDFFCTKIETFKHKMVSHGPKIRHYNVISKFYLRPSF